MGGKQSAKNSKRLHFAQRSVHALDLKYANNPKNYWVVELADGIIQRETGLLLLADEFRSRMNRLIFCANDAFGAIGGLKILNEKYKLAPDVLSGVLSSSPLHIRELSKYTDVPVFNSANPDQQFLAGLLVKNKPKKRAGDARNKAA